MFGRRNVAVLLAEFLGTAILTFVVLDVSRSTIGIPYFVAIAAGLAITLAGLSVGGVMGAGGVQLNPALTVALWTARQVATVRAVAYIVAQMLGGWAAYALYKYFSHGSVTHVSGNFEGRVMVAEAVGAFVFAFVVAGALYQRVDGFVRAATLGGAYTVGVLVASAASNALINPAVALGSNSWGWGNYVLGPVLGAVIGVNLYAMLFAPAGKLAAKKSK